MINSNDKTCGTHFSRKSEALRHKRARISSLISAYLNSNEAETIAGANELEISMDENADVITPRLLYALRISTESTT